MAIINMMNLVGPAVIGVVSAGKEIIAENRAKRNAEGLEFPFRTRFRRLDSVHTHYRRQPRETGRLPRVSWFNLILPCQGDSAVPMSRIYHDGGGKLSLIRTPSPHDSAL